MELEFSMTCSQQLATGLYPEPDQCSPYTHYISVRSILILFALVRQGLASDLFPSGFPIKTLYALIFSPIIATCPVHLTLM
jgi:hypothetical protein